MDSVGVSWRVWKFLLGVWMVMIGTLIGSSDSLCEFEGIFNFGDSNTDTGGFNAAFPAQVSPFGMTFFKKPVGRSSDGRLILDFLAQGLGLPYLSPYLQSIGSDYRHGANFASSASTVLEPTASLDVGGISPFHLAIQLRQLQHFKAIVSEFYEQAQGTNNNKNDAYSYLPSPDIFSKSIYTFYIGQNDFTSKVSAYGIPSLRESLPQIVSQIDATIREIYAEGGRTFLVFNLGPVGCYPGFLVELPHDPSDVDEFGCIVSYNDIVDDYNNLLRETLTATRENLVGATLIYVDVHSALLQLFRDPTSHGLKHNTRACCGHGGGDYNFEPKIMCGNMAASACDDPENYVSWDGIHFTEAANKIVARAILDGSISHPHFPLQQHCDLHPID
ncbi:hypothetical protein PIB30_051144 [Stylosanthes scabra]|uniref:Uncharacterized protein n=1 Tax=Stylosanthes scabra TaxID=79078 RepID=A0ABU6QI43_9FABA|nr:hypothetical protein [Stylosanthes scabra]